MTFQKAFELSQVLIGKTVNFFSRGIGSYLYVEIDDQQKELVKISNQKKPYKGEFSFVIYEEWQLHLKNKLLIDSRTTDPKKIDQIFGNLKPDSITGFAFDKSLKQTTLTLENGLTLTITKVKALQLWCLVNNQQHRELNAFGRGDFTYSHQKPFEMDPLKQKKFDQRFVQMRADPLRVFLQDDYPLAVTLINPLLQPLEKTKLRAIHEESGEGFSIECFNQKNKILLDIDANWQINRDNKVITSSKNVYSFYELLQKALHKTTIMSIDFNEKDQLLTVVFSNKTILTCRGKWSLLHRTLGYWIWKKSDRDYYYHISVPPDLEKKYQFSEKISLHLPYLLHELDFYRSWFAKGQSPSVEEL